MLQQFVDTDRDFKACGSGLGAGPEVNRRRARDGTRGSEVEGPGDWYSKIKLHLTCGSQHRFERSHEAPPLWGTS